MSKSNSTYFIVLLIFSATLMVFLILWVRRWSIPMDDTIKAVQAALNLDSTSLSPGEIDKGIAYKNREDKLPKEQFTGWEHNTDKLSEFALFGIKLLDFCATFESSYWENYQTIVTHMVEQLVTRLEQANPKKEEFKTTPWGSSRFVFFAHVTRLLAMYEYVGEQDYLKWKCHDQIVLIVPTIGRSLQSVDMPNDEKMTLLYQAVPRLCSNYMFDREEFQRDTINPNFIELQKFMRFEPVLQENPPTEGIYRDDSWVINGNVPSYNALLKFYNFHERVYQGLGFKTPIREIAKSVLEKLMHPVIKYQPLGLVNNDGKVFNNRVYWDIKLSTTGVNIMPFMGLGVFKTEKFLFHVRVQRPKLAAFEIETGVDPWLGIGAIQMRKMYLKNVMYKETFKWDDLIGQPGLISYCDMKNLSYYENLELEKNYKIKSIFTRQGDIISYVGRLEDNLMFWYNRYFFIPFRVFVEEAGVVTANGVQVCTEIQNTSEFDLQFAWKDDNDQLSCKAEIFTRDDYNSSSERVGEADPNVRFIECKPEKFMTIKWKMMLHESRDDYKPSFYGSMTFSDGKHSYKVSPIRKSRYYVEKENIVILGGSSSSDPNDSFTEKIGRSEYIFTRNSKTMMYQPKIVGSN